MQFKTQIDAVINRLICGPYKGGVIPVDTEPLQGGEPSEEVKEQMKKRDGYHCLCCGEDNKRLLEIDHITPRYYGGNNNIENLQTLCKICNEDKGINEVNYRYNRTNLTSPLDNASQPGFVLASDFTNPKEWEKEICRAVNAFYRCAAVASVEIGLRGSKARNWKITLYAGNNPNWLREYLNPILDNINEVRREDGYFEIESITVKAPGEKWIVLT
ncbi:HNH endonuclease [bacterium]|nr:HNH endonuclease [bacterium]